MDPAVRRRTDQVPMPGRDAPVPVIVLTHPQPGPSAVITANVHGDEVLGVAAAHELDERLVSELRCGSVAIYPSVNPRGLAAQSRFHPEDGVDLNRVFPGEARGGAAARAAAAVWSDLAPRRPDVVIDLHSDSAVSVPYALVDRATSLTPARRADLERRVRALARSTGLLVLLEYPPDEYVRFRLDRSLAGAVVNGLGVAALTLEVGPRRAVDPSSIRTVSDAVCRVFGQLGLTATPPGPESPPGTWRRAPAPRVQSAGLFVPRLAPGAPFVAGDILGTVRALDGVIREVVRADATGIVVSWAEAAWVEIRAVPGTLAVEE